MHNPAGVRLCMVLAPAHLSSGTNVSSQDATEHTVAMSIFCVTCGLIILRSPTNARDAINPTVDSAWEYGVTPSLEASERWSESLFLRLSKVLSQVSTWPATVSESAIQAYQALLLNVIFTLEYLDDMRFRKAYPRYCMMIAIFRGASLFQEQQIFVQDDTQDVIPTSWLIREKFKRLAFYTFRLDNYFYFLQGHYPVLRYEELCLATPSSERLWEATTAEEWHEIKEIESKKRATMLFMTLMDTAMDCEGRDTLPPLLEDDYVSLQETTGITNFGVGEDIRCPVSPMARGTSPETTARNIRYHGDERRLSDLLADRLHRSLGALQSRAHSLGIRSLGPGLRLLLHGLHNAPEHIDACRALGPI
ncbi:hypothetical protein CDV31_010523 [Fusarium ambrosium]|uniref:Xylanolytic transcriptional activator regulatory domain-containing protein n=1 Tax=Fusarium ambrosium TaxID=131363 RepID=A0A428TN00_9HYPO|nr:hypothetical protein CDV31_010523 [Fusarium ambrosium]